MGFITLGSEVPSGLKNRPPIGEAGLRSLFFFLGPPALFLVFLEAYLLCLNPAFPNDDSAETITAGATLGLQHPPGYALATLAMRLESLLPVGSPSLRVNAGSALSACAALCLLALVLFFFREAFPGKAGAQAWFPALVAPCYLAFSPAFWRNALGAKGGIYLLAACLSLALLGCLLRHEASPAPRKARWLFLSFFLLGLGLANHWETQVVFLPGFLLFFWLKPRAGTAPAAGAFVPALFFLALGASPLLYLPLRAHAHPVLDLGAPDTWRYFAADLSRHYVADREISLLGVLGQVLNGTSTGGRFLALLSEILRAQGLPLSQHLFSNPGPPCLALAVGGLLFWLRSRKERKVLLFLLVSLCVLFLALLSSLLVPDPDQGWILDNFLLPADWTLALLSGVGMGALLGRLPRSRARAAAVFLLLAALPFPAAFTAFRHRDQAKDILAYDYGVNLLKSAPRHSVLFAEGDPDYFSLYYLQQVEHLRPDVRMIPAFTLFEPWGAAQVERLYPGLGLTASPRDFPDHFARIIYASSEIVVKSRGKNPVGFTYFDGAFHRYYLARHPSLRFRKSGAVLLLDDPSFPAPPLLPLPGLRLRDFTDGPSEGDPSLRGIGAAYRAAGLSP